MNFNILKILSKSLSILVFSFFLLNSNAANANTNFSQLTPCKESQSFQKRLTSSIKKLENRLSLYEKDTKEYLALTNKIESTKMRFEKYQKQNMLCGKEGLPRIIASGQWNHANDFTIPGLIFLYIAGWIGWVGRKYLQWAASTENSFENEIIINIPVSLSIANSGFLWPLDAWKELASGKLLASKNDITVSPR